MKAKKRGKKITIKFDNKRESAQLLGALGFKNIAESLSRDAVEHCVELSSDKQTCTLCGGKLHPQKDGTLHCANHYCKSVQV